MSRHILQDWPLGPTSTVYMDGSAMYSVRSWGKPGAVQVNLPTGHADRLRQVVTERVRQVAADSYRAGALAQLERDPDSDPVPRLQQIMDAADRYVEELIQEGQL